MEIERQLDEILKLIINSTTIDNKAIVFEDIKSILKYENVFDLTSHLRQLQEDKFIDITNSIKDGLGNLISQQKHGVYYFSTTRGRLFEGYIKQKENENAERKSKEAYELRMESNAYRLQVGTWFLGIGTILLVIVEAISHWAEILSFFCHCH